MGFFKPDEGEIHRFVLELKGSKDLTQKQYERYKAAIEKAVKNHGAKIAGKEHVIAKKKGPK